MTWRGVRSWLRRRWWVVYLVLLAASLIVQMTGSMWSPPAWWYDEAFADESTWIGASSVEIPEVCDEGVVDGRLRLAYLEWSGEFSTRPPVILLHGSPGQAFDWTRQAPSIAAAGYRVLAVDRIGFGRSSPWASCYSARANARAVLAMMDALEIDRAHVVGWSHGGPVILNMADIAPDRLASMTMLGATGDQRVEGSGSYAFEHVKYAIGYAVVVVGAELVPHFGLLDRQVRHAFIRDFMDTDQRPLTAIMRRIETPTLILQGRHDPLVPARAAELHYQLIPTSRLVMEDAGHLFPFYDPEVGTAHLVEHFQRHDEPGVAARTDALILAPERAPAFGRVGRFAVETARQRPWWMLVCVIAALFLIQSELAAVLCAGLVASVDLDFGVAMAGLMVGGVVQAGISGVRLRGSIVRRPVRTAAAWVLRAEKRREAGAAAVRGDRRVVAGFVPGLVAWSLTALIVAQIVLMVLRRPWMGEVWIAAVALATAWCVRQSARALTWTGRQQLKAKATRLVRYEFWSPWVFYAPLVVYLGWLSIRSRGVLTFSCVNPGIAKGGGTLGERKSEIMEAFGEDRRVLPCVVVEPGGQAERVRRVEEIVAGEGFGWPVIIKPDAAQRGFGVKLVHDVDGAAAYFASMTRRVVVQPYHVGPYECGVLWVREPDATGRAGRIFSITDKVFQELEGDGEHTIEELIYRHRRYRAQARVFLARFDGQRVLGRGERLRLSIAGNHAQGARFNDGARLKTEGLERAIDEVCAAFRGIDGGELDYGRFDLRYESEEALARGEFGIVELNGAMAESTNIYDSTWSLVRAYRVLFEQWRVLYALGAWRRRQGRRPMGLGELASTAWGHYAGRKGPAVSD